MHEVEQYTWNCLNTLAQQIDPHRDGWVIDAGLGNGDYYAEWFSNLGYRALAIEPMPTDGARRMCEAARIPLVEAALGSTDGALTLYHAPDRDLRSLEGELWGGMTAGQEIRCITLPTLLAEHHIETITVLKLDIEGAEPAALAALPALTHANLPQIISVEFGGEWPRSTQRGVWQPLHQARVNEMFGMLRAFGYSGILIGSGDHLFVRPFKAGMPRFEDADNWGNAVLTRAAVTPATLCQLAEGVVV